MKTMLMSWQTNGLRMKFMLMASEEGGCETPRADFKRSIPVFEGPLLAGEPLSLFSILIFHFVFVH